MQLGSSGMHHGFRKNTSTEFPTQVRYLAWQAALPRRLSGADDLGKSLFQKDLSRYNHRPVARWRQGAWINKLSTY